jgi:hypothetical protein
MMKLHRTIYFYCSWNRSLAVCGRRRNPSQHIPGCLDVAVPYSLLSTPLPSSLRGGKSPSSSENLPAQFACWHQPYLARIRGRCQCRTCIGNDGLHMGINPYGIVQTLLRQTDVIADGIDRLEVNPLFTVSRSPSIRFKHILVCLIRLGATDSKKRRQDMPSLDAPEKT